MLLTKILLYTKNKGLLLAVVLCSCILGCTAPSSPVVEQEIKNPLPDPALFLQQSNNTTLPPDSLAVAEIQLLQTGDVLLRRGYGWISDYIVAALQEPCALTHCGLIVPHATGLGVLHTASSQEHEGLMIEPLANYIQQSQQYSLVACRPHCTPQQRTQLLALAQEYLQKAPPFDYSFDDQNAEELYCVELLRDLFLIVFKEDYLPLHYQRGKLSLLGFQSFFDSDKFTLLFNHCQPTHNAK